MNTVAIYKQFRKELDAFWVPGQLEHLNVEVLKHGDEEAGLLCYTDEAYIDCLYVLPKFRRHKVAEKAVKDLLDRKGWTTVYLHIINNNYPAISFWMKLFKLYGEQYSATDTYYRAVRRDA